MVFKSLVEAAHFSVPAFPGDVFDRLVRLLQEGAGFFHTFMQHKGVEGQADAFAELSLQFRFVDMEFAANAGNRDGAVEICVDVLPYLHEEAGFLLSHLEEV